MYQQATMLILFIQLLVASQLTSAQQTRARCMKTKCTPATLSREMRSKGGVDGLMKVLSWNVQGVDVSKICSAVSQIDLEVIGLQRVDYRQYIQLKRSCLSRYNASGIPENPSTPYASFNTIFYKNDRNVIQEVAKGNYGHMRWSKMTFQAYGGRRRYRRGVLAYNLLTILNGQSRPKKYARAIRARFYRKQVFVVNVDTEDSEREKEKTMHKLLSHLYFNILGRRRHRIILLGTFGWKNTLLKLRNFMRRRRRGSRTYFSMFRSALGNSAQTSMNGLINQIWMSNMRRSFRSVLSAVVETKTYNKPSFSMFIV